MTSRRWRTTWAAAVGVLLAGVVPPATAASGPTSGSLLYSHQVQPLGTGSGVTLPWFLSRAARFSPDGAQVADASTTCSDESCTNLVSTVTVRSSKGGSVDVATFPGPVRSIAWASDQSALAVLVVTNGADRTIYRVPLDGTAAVPLVHDDAALTLADSEISWQPGGNLVAFVATAGGGSSRDRDPDQLYTVPATGGPVTRLNQALPECQAAAPCRRLEFAAPEWSPDGTELAVEVADTADQTAATPTTTAYVGLVHPGQAIPTSVHPLQSTDLDHSTWAGPTWSADGAQILFDDDDGVAMYAGIVPVSGGPATRIGDAYFLDWQRCPDGTCADWSHVDNAPSAITLVPTTVRGIRVTGQVTPARGGQTVSVRLDRRAGSRWVKVATTASTLSATSRYVAKFASPSASRCRVTARYPGDTTTWPTSARTVFSC